MIKTDEEKIEERLASLGVERIKLEAKLNIIRENRSKVRLLSDYSFSEKEESFDRFYSAAIDHLKERENGGHDDDDAEHYMFEMIMDLLSIKGTNSLWEYYNSLEE